MASCNKASHQEKMVALLEDQLEYHSSHRQWRKCVEKSIGIHGPGHPVPEGHPPPSVQVNQRGQWVDSLVANRSASALSKIPRIMSTASG